MMFDTHTHLYIDDLESKIKQANSVGVKYMMIPSIDIPTWDKIIKLVEKYDGIYGAIGIHPTDVRDIDLSKFNRINKLLTHKKIKAVGEIGLDFYRDNNKDEQIEWFIKQLDIAKKFELPVIIHSREAHKETLEVLDFVDNYKTGVILHCYSGSAELAREYNKRGAYISLAGPVTYKNAKIPKEVAKVVDEDLLLIETDSPWLTPEPFRGKKNDPSKVEYVAREIANLRGIEFEELCQITTNNAKRVFKIEN